MIWTQNENKILKKEQDLNVDSQTLASHFFLQLNIPFYCVKTGLVYSINSTFYWLTEPNQDNGNFVVFVSIFFLFFSSLFSLCQLYINALQLFNPIFLSLLCSQFNRCRSSMKFSRSYINIIRIFKTFIFKLAFSGKPKNWKEKRYSFKLSQIFCRRNQQFYILFRGFFMLFF